MTFSLFDMVLLTQDLPKDKLFAGMVGTVVDVYSKPVVGYEIEFCDALGRTVALLAVSPEKLRLLSN
jgi:Domain of unknown function (DUF4926)